MSSTSKGPWTSDISAGRDAGSHCQNQNRTRSQQSLSQTQGRKGRLPLEDKSQAGTNKNKHVLIEPRAVYSAIHEETTKLKAREIIDLGSVDKVTELPDSDDWKIVGRRQRRNSRGGRALEGSAASGAVIGTLNGLNSHRRKNNKFAIYGIAVETAAIKAVPRKSSLFVSRIMPGTTSGDMEAFLRDDFPEVACIELPSKHPDSYASFKVTLNSDNFSKAHTPDRWPSGVYVDRFFQKKTTIA